jgi:hypothetical protein
MFRYSGLGMPTADIKNLFFAGDYDQVISLGLTGKALADLDLDFLGWIVGALVFSGRVEDAFTSMQICGGHASVDQLVAARFFCTIAAVRRSDYATARSLVIENAREARSDFGFFFLWQGIGFYRYFCGRFKLAENAAQKARRYALSAGFEYGRMLATDLSGYAFWQSGQLSKGSETLQEARSTCKTEGFGAHLGAIETSITVLNASINIDAGHDFVRANHGGTFKYDTISEVARRLELARLKILHGKLRSAETDLNHAARVLLSSNHRRYESLMLHLLGHIRFLQGNNEAAKEMLEQALGKITVGIDNHIELKVRGLIAKLDGNEIVRVHSDSRPNLLSSVTENNQRLLRLTKICQTGIGHNILARTFHRLSDYSKSVRGDDPLGDLLTDCVKLESRRRTLSLACQNGLFGALFVAHPEFRGRQIIVLGLLPSYALCLDRGEVVRGTHRLSTTSTAILRELANNPEGLSKEELIERIWGYEYHPVRHDPVLFSALTRLRRALGDCSSWIHFDSGRFFLTNEAEVLVYARPILDQIESLAKPSDIQKKIDSTRNEAFSQGPIVNSTLEASASFNYRQLLLLEEIKKGSFISVGTYSKNHKITRMSALRDLSELVNSGLFRRVGRARATAYQRL